MCLQLTAAIAVKEKGNVAFKAGKLAKAIKDWDKVCLSLSFATSVSVVVLILHLHGVMVRLSSTCPLLLSLSFPISLSLSFPISLSLVLSVPSLLLYALFDQGRLACRCKHSDLQTGH